MRCWWHMPGGGAARRIAESSGDDEEHSSNPVTPTRKLQRIRKGAPAARAEESESEEREPEKIVGERRDNGVEYLVKWRGLPSSQATWEPKALLAGCDAVLQDWRAELQQDTAEQLQRPVRRAARLRRQRGKRCNWRQ